MHLENFKNWLAGIIDSKGKFYISSQRIDLQNLKGRKKKMFPLPLKMKENQELINCEIIMSEKEIQTLYFIKKYLGGSIFKRKKTKNCR